MPLHFNDLWWAERSIWRQLAGRRVGPTASTGTGLREAPEIKGGSVEM